ncbi:MAG: ABC transporter ATP-binding protein [Tistrella sp.]|uniref:ABC transporter ATP-binding protein n=1 Tax=Tistrella mobilis TaxID=171437 RepID=A0A3B9ISR2_9PROT|nr:ATP-binding cassette domain-containing protein [Tistrella sp.]MAD36746.1 ABC transporter ATP-binding protein [Tistrella sp.]MBA75854.1 ABC transporter ATP-binding protein [Tistrella sp.]HAE50835.1 ABC transporter ATP-binding protein [Tistrella mobilis]
MTAAPELLTIRDLAISFGGLKAVDGIDVTVEQGEVHALIGPNGAGKTTVLNCVSRFYDAARGSIRFGGQELLGLKPHRVARLGIARTFQNLELFPELSVLDNVLIGRDRAMSAGILPAMLRLPSERREARRERDHALGLIDEVGLGGDADAIVADLPYGRQKLAELARALALDPRLLLLDEPAAGMNQTEARTLGDLLLRLRDRHGLTILLIEHNMSLVMRVSDRITVMEQGRFLAAGTPPEIERHEAVIAAYLGNRDADAIPRRDRRRLGPTKEMAHA